MEPRTEARYPLAPDGLVRCLAVEAAVAGHVIGIVAALAALHDAIAAAGAVVGAFVVVLSVAVVARFHPVDLAVTAEPNGLEVVRWHVGIEG